MVSREIHHTTALANEIGKRYGVTCRYEWDHVKRAFVWRFFRHGTRIGQTAKPGDVIKRMEKYTTTEEKNHG